MEQEGQKSSLKADPKIFGQGWQVPTIGTVSSQTSCFHRCDVRIKIVSLFTYSLLVSFVSQLETAFLAMFFSLSAVIIAKVSVKQTLRRLMAMSGFLAMLLVILPFTAVSKAGDQLIYITSFPLVFNLRGFDLAVTILFKATAIAMVMDPLFNTAPLPVTTQALNRLGIPAIICQMILMAHRYIFVLLHEAKRMNMGMRVRGFRKRTNMETIKVLGHFVGMLMIRSVDRSERVHQAMLARGYSGSFQASDSFQATTKDWFFGLIWPALALSLIIIEAKGL